jgi:hypothetical protein
VQSDRGKRAESRNVARISDPTTDPSPDERTAARAETR